jgi:hypothetical protein
MVFVTTSGVTLRVGRVGEPVATVGLIDAVAVGVARVSGARESAIKPTQ